MTSRGDERITISRDQLHYLVNAFHELVTFIDLGGYPAEVDRSRRKVMAALADLAEGAKKADE